MNSNNKSLKRQLLLILSILLIAGFLTVSLVSYYVAKNSLSKQLTSNELPLTSDNIYSEIQRDLLQPVFITSLMANDTFLRNWVLQGEKNPREIAQYLDEIKRKYKTFTSFFVSNRTGNYYYPKGIMKKVSPDEPRDAWFYRVRKMKPDFEINIDPDMANNDTMTIFVNHKVFDFKGCFIGATGVGLNINRVLNLIKEYHLKYHRNIAFVDKLGKVILSSSSHTACGDNINKLEGLSKVATEIFDNERHSFEYCANGRDIYLNTRYIPELNWYLLVSQTEDSILENVFNTLIANLVLCGIVILFAILITWVTINSYQKKLEIMVISDEALQEKSLQQQNEIEQKQEKLAQQEENLKKALDEIQQLSGLLPICSSCKKIQDKNGNWEQLETYITNSGSGAQFSHSICPDCAKRLYPDL
jgi:hypothetical protein